MPPTDLTGEERRRILERRRQARQEERDRQAEEAERAGMRIPERIPEHRTENRKTTAESRQSQICFVCREQFMPDANGQTICSSCRMDGIRGGGRGGQRGTRF